MELLEIVRSLGALLFVLALFLLCAWAFRRYGIEQKFKLKKTPTEKQMRVEESVMLDAKHRLVLVKRAQKSYLLLLGGAQGVVVDVLVDAVEQENDEHA